MQKENPKNVYTVIIAIGVGLFTIIILSALVIHFIFDYIFGRKYYSNTQVKTFTETLVPDCTYIKKKNLKKLSGHVYYLFKDSNGKEFVIMSSSFQDLFFYKPKLWNGYKCCIFQKNHDKIKDALDDTGLSYTIDDASKMQDDILEWASESLPIYQTGISFRNIKEKDFTVIANALTRIDGILEYNYNEGMESDFCYQDSSWYDVCIYLADLEYGNLIHINFSTSERERWSQEYLYDCIQKQYQTIVIEHTQSEKRKQEEKEKQERIEKEKLEKERLEQTVKLDMLNYLTEKYDETFIVNDATSIFTLDDETGGACLWLHCERLPSVTIEVLGYKNEDGTYSYTDDFDEGRRYEKK